MYDPNSGAVFVGAQLIKIMGRQAHQSLFR
jgi:hypothetical protein